MRTRRKLDANEVAKAKRKKMLDKMKEELEIKRQMDQEEAELEPGVLSGPPMRDEAPGLMREVREAKDDSESDEEDSFITEISDSIHSRKDAAVKGGNSASGSSSVSVCVDSQTSSARLNKRIKELGFDKDFLTVECGCRDHNVLQDENLLDQFLVLKSILDRNLPKLVESDIEILKHICVFVFPEIPSPEIENTNEIRSMIEFKLEQSHFTVAEDCV